LSEDITEAEAPTPAPEADQVDAQPDAPETGTSEHATPEADLDAPFRLDDVDESYRSDVERYAKQLQGAYTRKTQELAEQRRELEDLQQLREKLYSEDTEQREQALQGLLDELGYELDKDDDTTDTLNDEYVDPVEELRQRLDAREQAEAQAAAEAKELAAVEAQVNAAQEALAAYEQDSGELSETAKTAIVTYAGSLPRTSDGLPDMESAIKLWESDRAEAVENYLNSKRNVEAAPDLNGSTGTEQVNLSDRATRLRMAEAAAERAAAQHA
jgi:chromosome segregation ATPase